VICKVDLFLVRVRLSYRLPLAKTDYLPLPPPPLPPYAMQPANLRSYTGAKAISEYALQLPSVYLVFAIQFQSVHHSQCKQGLLRKFY
jgi:hypothetical protein